MKGDDDDRSTWTLAAVKARGLAVEGYCETGGCKRFYTFNLESLIESAGADYRIPKFLPGITCEACGGRLKFMLASLHPEN